MIMLRLSIDDTNAVSGNESGKSSEMWKIARRYNQQSIRMNGYVTSQKRRFVKSFRAVPLT